MKLKETAQQQHARQLKAEESKCHIFVKRELRNLRAHLRDLVECARVSIAALDEEMKKPSTVERGKRIAKITNYLEMAKDRTRMFGLHK